jgi:glycine/sarcosine N-methyltransferase
MSKFYSEIAKYYDYIFPTGKAQLELITSLAGETPKDILDVACGSGGYSMSLRQSGYKVTAIDLDEEMVDSLRSKNKDIDARVLNMLDIEALNKKFDLIFCIGNSLVHLKDNEEIYKFFKACKNSLKPKGQLVLQIVNYDRVLERDVKSLPTIENKEVNLVFERHYEYLKDEHKVDFKTVLKVGEEELENHVLLHPAKSTELQELLLKTGFSSLELYGSFKKEQFNPMESFPLVVVAE